MYQHIHTLILQVHVSVEGSAPQKQNIAKQEAQHRRTTEAEQVLPDQAAAAKAAKPISEKHTAAVDVGEASETVIETNVERAQSGSEATQAAEQADRKLRQKPGSSARVIIAGDKGKPRGYVSAISANGFTTRGRVRQKSHKSAQLVSVGKLRYI